MTKRLVYFLLGLLLVSCSSVQKTETQSQTKLPSRSEKADQTPNQVPPEELKKDENGLIEMKPAGDDRVVSKAISAEANNKQYQNVRNAIESKNAELIKSASLDVLQTDFKNSVGLNSLAMSYYKKGQHDTAEFIINRLIEINPNSPTAHSNLGLIYLAQKKERAAVESFEKALDLDSSHQPAIENLSSVYLRVYEFEKAAKLLDQLEKKSESNQLNYAVALAGQGQYKESAERYEKILSENAGNKLAIYNLAYLKIEKLSEYQEGLDLLSRLKFVDTNFVSENTIKQLENKAKAGLK